MTTRHPLRAPTRPVLIAVLLAAFLIPATVAHACTCAVGTTAEQLDAAELVFAGTVQSTRPDPKGANELPRRQTAFKVFAVYKGSAGATVSVFAFEDTSACGIPFAKGKTYVVFAHHQEDELVTDLCSGTTDDTAVVADLPVIRKGPGPTPKPQALAPTSEHSRIYTIALATLLAVTVAGATVLVRRASQRPRPFV